MREPWIVGVTGASGTPYAAAVLRALFDAGPGPQRTACGVLPGLGGHFMAA